MSEAKKTALYPLHVELAAKMINFAGYKMPQQYKQGIIHEHLHCRQQAGFFDISHMGQCLVTGNNAAQALERLVPSNISGLAYGQQRYTVLCNEQGGIIDDIIISRLTQGYAVIVNAACKEKDFILLSNSLPNHCQLEVLADQALFALQGPAAHSIMQQLCPLAAELKFMQSCHSQIAEVNCQISRCGYTGEDGFEISVANQHAAALAKQILAHEQVLPIGLGARDSLRLEAGLSLYGHELNETISPVEAGLKWLLRDDLSSFLAADIIHKQLSEGTTTKRAAFIIEGKIPVRQHSIILNCQNSPVGIITSGGFSPCLQQPIALAQINSSSTESDLYVKLRNKLITLQLTPSPFVPHRYHR